MLFNLEDMFEKSSNIMKYGFEPYPNYFLTYDWASAEKEADNNIQNNKLSSVHIQAESTLQVKCNKTERFDKDLKVLPDTVREKIDNKILPLLLTDPKNHKIKAKRVKGHSVRWKINIDMYYTFSFETVNNSINLRCIGPIERS